MDILLIFIVAALLFFVQIIIARKLFGMEIIVRELNIQRLLLQKMAEKAGVSKEDIDFAIGRDEKK